MSASSAAQNSLCNCLQCITYVTQGSGMKKRAYEYHQTRELIKRAREGNIH